MSSLSYIIEGVSLLTIEPRLFAVVKFLSSSNQRSATFALLDAEKVFVEVLPAELMKLIALPTAFFKVKELLPTLTITFLPLVFVEYFPLVILIVSFALKPTTVSLP